MKNPIKISSFFNTAGSKAVSMLLCLFIIVSSYAAPSPVAVKGVLNLQNRDWTNNGIIDLNGEWEFYWHALYNPASFNSADVKPAIYASVPDSWNSLVPSLGVLSPGFGYATYRLKVLCPPSGEKLELKFLTVASAYKLFVNGKQIGEVGKVGTSEATTTPAYQPATFSVMPENGEVNIIIQVANFSYATGGLWDWVKLGTETQIETYHTKSIGRNFFVAGSFLLIGIFYLFIYFFFRRRRSPLYFALFCISIGVRALVTDEIGITYFTDWNWQTIKHIEFIFLYLTVPVLSLFSYGLFRREFSEKVLRFILIISALFMGIAVFASPLVFRYTLRPFQAFMVFTACYGWYVYIRAVKNKRTGSVYFLTGYIVLFIAIIHDILYTSLIIESTSLLYAGLYIFVICQAAALSRQFFGAYTKIEKLNVQLEGVNNELNRKNDTIRQTNEQLSKLNEELDILVFRTSHDLRSPITSVFAMADIIKLEQDGGKREEYIDFQKKVLLRLDDIISDILRYSKNKNTGLVYESTDLLQFVNDALGNHVFANQSENINRVIEVTQSADFSTDKMRLGMILNNLVSNALKHHNKKGETAFVKVAVKATEKEAEIYVEDNGPGIAQAHVDQIFTKYYRVNKNLDGSGLGLYIVKDAVEKLGGTIRVESVVNKGTTFFIVLPNGEPA